MCIIRDAFTCTSRQCIDSSTICDGMANCLDGSDETENLCTQLFPSYGQNVNNKNY